ncbi:heme peroxidase [Pavlovales sp. CCMP2436]|nr:heme peroxidase [Pavlovales sp. CCMP2436]
MALALLACAVAGGAPTARLGRRQLLAGTAAFASSGLLTLRPGVATVAFDMSRYGDREIQVAALNQLKQTVRDAARAEPALIPGLFELAVADGLDYLTARGAGGLDGSVRFAKPSDPALAAALATVATLQRKLVARTEVTFADMLAYSGGQALEIVGGPRVLVQLGRDDAQAGGAPPATTLISWSPSGLAQLKSTLAAAGLGSRELVLLGGALGSLRMAASSAKVSGAETFSADEDEETTAELAGYAEPEGKSKGAVEVRLPGLDFKKGVDTGAPFGSAYLKALVTSGASPADPIGVMLMSEPELAAFVRKYADTPAAFGKEVAQVYQTLTTLGKVTSTRNS